MSNTTLFFRSLLIVAVLAGIPHALALYANQKDTSTSYEQEKPDTTSEDEAPLQDLKDWAYYWQGKYEVSFEGLKEKAIYEIKNTDGQLSCYSVALIDAEGNRYDDNSLVMKSISIEEYKATAKYTIDYEGEKYEVDSQILMDEEGNLTLSYTYYGYEGKETWTRIK